jgi:hypothetical protein
MKRIIITERQYKRLVNQPLNEQKDKGGDWIFEDGYSSDDLTTNMVLFLNTLKRVLKVMYKKSVYIKKVKNHILTIDLSKYNKKQINTIRYESEDYFRRSEYLDDKYSSEKGEMFFGPDFYKLDDPEEDIVIDEPEENVEDIVIDEPEENVEDIVIDEPEENVEDIVDECYTKDEVKLYQNNIKDLKETNDFRYWISQDKDRLKKVNDKLKKCDMPDGLDMSGSYDDESPYMIVAFSEIGQEWVDDKKPIKVVPPLSTNYDDPAMGLKKGGVDSGLAMTGGTDDNWDGSMPRLLAIAKMAKDYFDVNVTSQKRKKKKTANGSTSAHYYKNFGKYAIDLRVPTVKKDTPKNTKGDDLFNKIVELLGKPNLKSGKWRPIKYKGYRYNVGWRADGDHMNHIHIGVNKL